MNPQVSRPGEAPPSDWYYARDGKKGGPVTFQQLQRFAAAGKLRPSDQVFGPGLTEWQLAGNLPELFGKNPLAIAAVMVSPSATIPQLQPVAPPLAIPVGLSRQTPPPPPAEGFLSHPVRLALLCAGSLSFVALGIVLVIYCFTGTGAAVPAPPPPPDNPGAGVPPPPPLTPRQKQIKATVERGVAYLRQRLREGGRFYAFGDPEGGAHSGAMALLGLTLLECEVGPHDADVKLVAEQVRQSAPRLRFTYSIAVSILFLDRLNADPRMPANPDDIQLLQTLALRLIASQNRAAGWDYFCRLLGKEEESKLLAELQANRYRTGDFWRHPGGIPHDDNSISQFVTLALWASRKHQIPVREPLLAVENRYRGKQRPDGSWTYHDLNIYLKDTSTCAALIGLAVGRGARDDVKGGGTELLKDPAVTRGLQYLKAVVGTEHRVSAEDRARKMQITLELESIMVQLETAKNQGEVQRLVNRLNVIDNSRENRGMLFNGDNWGDLYFLWSLERMAVIYDLKKIGDVDWHEWGTDLILKHQEADGSWRERFPGVPDTCFALLFLRRANLVKDLTDKLRELVAGLGNPPQPMRRD